MLSQEKENNKLKKAIIQFFKNDCKEQFFTKTIYEFLHQKCGFIAHFDKSNFYRFYFTSIEGMNNFINKINETLKYNSHQELKLFLLNELKKYLMV